MDWHTVLQAFLSLIFVIGLLLLTLWLFKYCQLKGSGCRLFKQIKNAQRLDVLESRRLDSRTTLVLVRKDNQEYLLLLGAGSNQVLDRSSSPQRPENND